MASYGKKLAALAAVAAAAATTTGITASPAATAATAATAAAAATARGPQVEAYFADWDIYGRGYFPKDIPASRLTTLLYAFATPTADGTCAVGDSWADYQRPFAANESVDGAADSPDQPLFGNFNQLLELKAAHPNLRIVMSIGGWSFSTYFSDVAATAQTRQKFVASCIDQFISGNLPGAPAGAAAGVFDGIDIDWEYPGVDPGNGAHYRPGDVHRATLLLREFRRQLDALGSADHRHYLLTAALPASSGAGQKWELPQATAPLDWANVMTYDFHGGWDPVTDFDSPYLRDRTDPTTSDPTWNTAGTISYYLNAGVPASKIAVGVPFYGLQFIRTGTANNGLYQPFDNTGLDANSLEWDVTPNPTYHDLVDVAHVLTGTTASGGFQHNFDWRAGEPWLYSPAAPHALASGTVTAPTVITYESPWSVRERARLVKALHLRGIFAWEISQDADAHPLTNAMASTR